MGVQHGGGVQLPRPQRTAGREKVDVTGVNDLFKDSFQNQKIFTFNIKNLATHYVPKDTSYKEGEPEKLPENAYKSAHGSSDASASLEYVQNLPSDIGTGSAVLWSATMDDPTSAHREKRRGTLPLMYTNQYRPVQLPDL